MNPKTIVAVAFLILGAWDCRTSWARTQQSETHFVRTSSTAVAAGAGAASPCSSLARAALPDATITRAESVASGQYQLSPQSQRLGAQPGMNITGQASLPENPEFCRVAVTLKPSADSVIKMEVWLPQSGWNGKLLTAGNFGWGGALMYAPMLSALAAGYATASTDTGHDSNAPDGGGGAFALGHPEKLVDYAYRADHELTTTAKALIKAFYGRDPAHSYWIGCSLGGLEGLIEARRYPNDYDGIVAGAPPNPLARFNALQLWPSWLINQDPSRLIPPQKYARVHQAVLESCASPLGRKDGVVDEPDKCRFDPAQLQCKGQDAPDCLTAAQVYLLQQTYIGPRNPRTGELIFPGPARGSELEMYPFANGKEPRIALDLFRYAAFQDAAWNWKTMDWDREMAAAIDRIGPLLHVDSELKPFFEHGGKLLMYIGWNDYHNPEQLIEYYKSVTKSSGAGAGNSLRLFTIPGMNHCAGGAGCDTFDKLGAIDDWVARGRAPGRIPASRIEAGKVVRTRPLCAYPEVARYKGAGSTDDAANFSCAVE